MCRKGTNFDSKELSRELGDRGDLVACLTSQIGTAVERDETVPKKDVRELETAVDDIENLLEVVEDEGWISPKADDGGRASAD